MNWSETGVLITALLFAVIAAPNTGETEVPGQSSPTTGELDTEQPADPGYEELVKTSCEHGGKPFLNEKKLKATLRLPTDPKFDDPKTLSLFSNTDKLLNLHLTTSLEYLLLGSKFNQWNSYRPGFWKYFDALADDAWNDAVELIHHMTKRGYTPKVSIKKPFGEEKVGGYTELDALAISLDKEKTLATTTMDIMLQAHSQTHDPEMFHYLAEHLSDVRTKKIKTSANHVNTLYKAVKNVGQDTDKVGDSLFALYIYDTQVLMK